MIHWYLQKGIPAEYTAALGIISKEFYAASMQVEIEDGQKAFSQAGR